jgi:hypothetical protein
MKGDSHGLFTDSLLAWDLPRDTEENYKKLQSG